MDCTRKRNLSITRHLIKHQGFQNIAYRDHSSITYRSDDLLVRLLNDCSDYELSAVNAENPKASLLLSFKENLLLSLEDKMAVMRETIDWYRQESEYDEKDEVDGFTDSGDDDGEGEICSLPVVKVDSERKLIIYVWGRKKRSSLPQRVDHNFNAAVLHGKKKGTNWRLDGRSKEIRDAVMRIRAFPRFLEVALNHIENKDCHSIGVNCRAGRHRSVTVALILKMHYYPLADVRLLEIR